MVNYGLCYGLITNVDFKSAETDCAVDFDGSLAITDTLDKLDYLTGHAIFAGER